MNERLTNANSTIDKLTKDKNNFEQKQNLLVTFKFCYFSTEKNLIKIKF